MNKNRIDGYLAFALAVAFSSPLASAAGASGARVEFAAGSVANVRAMYSAALPVIDKTISIIECVPGGAHTFRTVQAAQEAIGQLHQYQTDSARHASWYVFPMEQTKYHANSACLTVSNVLVNAPAPNTLVLKVTYLASDSNETVRQTNRYRLDPDGIWRLASFDNG